MNFSDGIDLDGNKTIMKEFNIGGSPSMNSNKSIANSYAQSKKSLKQITLDYSKTDEPQIDLLKQKEDEEDKKSKRWFQSREIESKHKEAHEAEGTLDKIFNETSEQRIKKKIDDLQNRTELKKATLVKNDDSIDDTLIEVGLKDHDKLAHAIARTKTHKELEKLKSNYGGSDKKSSYKSQTILPEINTSKYNMQIKPEGGMSINTKDPLQSLKDQEIVYNRAYFKKNKETTSQSQSNKSSFSRARSNI